MANGTMPTWEEWNEQLTEEQRKYSLYKIMASMDTRLSSLESRRARNTVVQFVGGMIGGAMAFLGIRQVG